jgi:OmpA-OmpF porin, OOP family
MRIHKILFPLAALTGLGLVGATANGCHAQATATIGGTESPPPLPPPPPPPARSTAEAAPPPLPQAAPPPKKVIALKGAQMKSPTQIDMPGDIEYETGSAKIVLNDKSKKVLTMLATLLKDNPELTKLRIEGHTDNAGETKGFDNTKLSEERAQSVADWLEKSGIGPGRLTLVGWGSKHPLAPNDTHEHMAANRRTEFHVQEFAGDPVDGGETAGAPAAATASSGSPVTSTNDAEKPPPKK